MKKLITLFIVLAAAFSLSAEFRWGGVEEDWSLTLSPMDPLFKESRSYPFSNNVTF
ncbi:MAG: hypothetical protein II339_00060 [Spirochaetales bacterium]|nr:hypothetical protein [Spirochaetales bacterium]